MQALIYYLTYPFIYLISISPFWLLYRISDALYILLYSIFGYRKSIVIDNLRRSFPEKSEKEIQILCKKSFQSLSDVIVEAIKTINISEKDLLKHIKVNNQDIIQQLYKDKKSFVLVAGHFGNWEWGGLAFSLAVQHEIFAVYTPLTNPYFNKLFKNSRKKFGARLIPRKETFAILEKEFDDVVGGICLVADQSPNLKRARWMTFLNQDTAVFSGPEHFAKQYDLPVVYVSVQRIRRGHYELDIKLITETPNQTEDMEITTTYFRALEDTIRQAPECWLWSHRRWKHQKPEGLKNEGFNPKKNSEN